MGRSITKLVSIAFLGALIGKGLRYALNVVIARGLGTDALGIFAFGLVVMKAGSVLARFGLEGGAQKFVPIYRSNGDDAKVTGTAVLCLGIPLLVGTILALVFYFGQGIIFAVVDVTMRSQVELFYLGIPLFATLMVGLAVTRGLKETKYAVYARDFGQSGFAILLVGGGAYVLDSLQYVIAGYLISLFLGIALVIYFLHVEEVFTIQNSVSWNTQELLVFSLPLLLSATMQYLVSWTDIFFLGILTSATETGWYQAVYQTSVLLTLVLKSANTILPSVVSDFTHNDRQTQLARLYTSLTKWVTVLTVLGFLFLCLFSEEVLNLFGTVTRETEVALVVLGAGQMITASTGVSGYFLIMSDYERLEAVNTSIVAVLNVALNFVLIQHLGLLGAAIATAISLALVNTLRLLEVWYLLGIQPYSLKYLREFFAVGCATLVMWFGRQLPVPGVVRVFAIGGLSLLVFFAIVWLLGFDEGDNILFDSIE
ncbi:oligosaccharide flippase family protein [Halorussus salilacus]|uniref:oligosaccharide flippase family protein n=1 Tax=Halorussus salilacus TaxID=2953750 RepID=UPI00209D24B4|nr:oligosaccharide flippase family protein [Halorussus salilacus]USZ67401.1 oligosaccharide flippase family protein [Halorussus salilacus]